MVNKKLSSVGVDVFGLSRAMVIDDAEGSEADKGHKTNVYSFSFLASVCASLFKIIESGTTVKFSAPGEE